MTSSMPAPAIELHQVTRDFGPVRALDDLALLVEPGSVTVLLGPNGAGKTTTVRLITGSLAPNSGSVAVFGRDPVVDGAWVRARCGVVPPKPAMWDQLTGWENLQFAAEIFDADPDEVEMAAKQFGIDDALHLEVGGYSTGMRTRLALARAVIHDPDVLLLDEPTAGLDPESARAVLDLIRDLAGRGRTIVMCTHLLHEAEGIADQVVLMRAGRAHVAGQPTELAARYMAEAVVIIDAVDRSSLSRVARHPAVIATSWQDAMELKLDTLDALPSVVQFLVHEGVKVTRVEPKAATLEHLYFEMQRRVSVAE